MRRRSSGQERRHFRELAGFCTSLLRSELVTLGSAWQSPSRPRRFCIGLLLSELATAVRFWFGSLGFRRLCTSLLRSEFATGTQGLAACRRKRRFEKSVEDCDVWAQLAPKRARGRGGYVMPQVAGVVLAKGGAGTKVRARVWCPRLLRLSLPKDNPSEGLPKVVRGRRCVQCVCPGLSRLSLPKGNPLECLGNVAPGRRCVQCLLP
jgi:hypothetical protein